MKGFFVTGTDTGVGKTAVAGALAAGLRRRGLDPGVMKPVASGDAQTSADAVFLARLAGIGDPPDLVCPVRLALPLAPSVAAELTGEAVDLFRVEEAFRTLAGRHRVMVVEGVGGLMVPLAGDFLVEDLAARLGLSLVVVARPGLGTVNHTLLTVARARHKGLRLAGVIINGAGEPPDLAESTNPRVIAELGDVRILGVIPRDGGVDVEAGRAGRLPALAEEHLDWPALLAELEGL